MISHNSYAKSVDKLPEQCVRAPKLSEDERRERELARKRRYYRENIEQVLAYEKNRRSLKGDEINEYHDRWMSIPENRERKNQKDREWRKNNPTLVMIYSNSRRARKLQAQPKWLTFVHLAQISEMYEIAQARSMQTGVKYHVDHIFPLHHAKFSGLHVPWNLQVMEGRENLRKKQKVPTEFSHMLFA